mgnify:CR=1 FL=1
MTKEGKPDGRTKEGKDFNTKNGKTADVAIPQPSITEYSGKLTKQGLPDARTKEGKAERERQATE